MEESRIYGLTVHDSDISVLLEVKKKSEKEELQ